jgi:hypothetical protein
MAVADAVFSADQKKCYLAFLLSSQANRIAENDTQGRFPEYRYERL